MAEGLESVAESLPGGKAKLGGKSIYIYGVAIGLIVVAYLWWSHRNSPPAAEADTTGDFGTPNVSGDLGDLPPSTGAINTSTDDTTTTNGYWEAQAVAWLGTQGTNPLSAQQALELYLEGQPLNYDQSLIVNKALGHFGLPPQGVADTPQPTTSQTTTSTPAAPKWSGKPTNYKAIGTVKVYHSPGGNSYRTIPPGHVITIVQTATVNGVLWGRTIGGQYFTMSDLIATTQKPTSTSKAKAK